MNSYNFFQFVGSAPISTAATPLETFVEIRQVFVAPIQVTCVVSTIFQ